MAATRSLNHLGNVLSVITDRKLIGGNAVEGAPLYNFTFEGTTHGFAATSTGTAPTVDNGRLALTATANNGGAQKDISLAPGKTYRVSFDVARGSYAPTLTADMTYAIGITVSLSGSITTSSSGHQSFTVTLPADIPANLDHQLRFRLRQGDYTGWPHSFYIDNITVSELTSILVTGLQPDVVEYHDYDPFGMLINKRTHDEGANGNGYRYGFQGQEKDNEIKGIDGSSLNYTFRMHDPRVGRFFAVDPLAPKYPFYSPYQFSSNSPIYAIELEGLESSQQPNQNEKSKDKKAGLSFIEKSLIGLLGTLYNINEVSSGNPPSSDPFSDKDFGKKVVEGTKTLYNVSFEVMGVAELAKFGVGGVDGEMSFKIKNPFSVLRGSFGAAKTTFSNGLRISLPKIFSKEINVIPRLVLDDWTFAFGGNRAWGRVDGKQIGFYTLKGNALHMELNIPKELQGLGFGSRFFSEAVKESEATVFVATWVKSDIYETGSSVNLTRYQSALKNGSTPQNAAFKTWSGQQAKKHGFTNVTITEIENGVQATFTKP